MAIFYIRSGVNQNDASTYTIVKLYFEQATEQPNEQPNKQAEEQSDEYIITKLNLLLNYLQRGIYADGYEVGLKPTDREPLIILLKRLELYTEKESAYSLMPPEAVLDNKILIWCVKELYLSPHKVFLMKLNWEKLTHKYLKTKKYITEKPNYRLEEVINYCMVCLYEELEKAKGGWKE